MSLFLASFVVASFALTIHWLELPVKGREAGERAADCLGVLRDASLDDDAKERVLRQHAIRFFPLIGRLGGGSALGLLVPLGVVWLLEQAGLASLASVLEVLQRLDFILVTAIVGLCVYLMVRRSARA